MPSSFNAVANISINPNSLRTAISQVKSAFAQLNVSGSGGFSSISGASSSVNKLNKSFGNLNNTLRTGHGHINGYIRPLGRLSGETSEFSKSLDAATARVFAFGASAIALNILRQGFKQLFIQSVEVEKALNDIQSVGGKTADEMQKVRKTLFEVGSSTAKSFIEVAEAQSELERQGLSTVESQKRLESAMILSRIAGLDSESSVKALTVALNSYNNAGLEAADITNKIVAVDRAAAVSGADLAESIARVGSTAVDANVSYEELLALTTAIQQKTGRGGSVIGNALKSIFTRISRGSVIDQLRALGVEIDATSGGIQKLTQIGQALKNISDPTIQTKIKELVGGVYQINQVSAALNDLGDPNGQYLKSLADGLNAGNTAFEVNAKLNETVAAQLKVLLNQFIDLGSAMGELAILDKINSMFRNFSGYVETVIGLVSSKETNGLQIFIKALSTAAFGPGLGLVAKLLLRMFGLIREFAVQGVKDLLSVNHGIGQTNQSLSQSIPIQQNRIKLIGDEKNAVMQLSNAYGNLNGKIFSDQDIKNIQKTSKKLSKDDDAIARLTEAYGNTYSTNSGQTLLSGLSGRVRTLPRGAKSYGIPLGQNQRANVGIRNFLKQQQIFNSFGGNRTQISKAYEEKARALIASMNTSIQDEKQLFYMKKRIRQELFELGRTYNINQSGMRAFNVLLSEQSNSVRSNIMAQKALTGELVKETLEYQASRPDIYGKQSGTSSSGGGSGAAGAVLAGGIAGVAGAKLASGKGISGILSKLKGVAGNLKPGLSGLVALPIVISLFEDEFDPEKSAGQFVNALSTAASGSAALAFLVDPRIAAALFVRSLIKELTIREFDLLGKLGIIDSIESPASNSITLLLEKGRERFNKGQIEREEAVTNAIRKLSYTAVRGDANRLIEDFKSKVQVSALKSSDGEKIIKPLLDIGFSLEDLEKIRERRGPTGEKSGFNESERERIRLSGIKTEDFDSRRVSDVADIEKFLTTTRDFFTLSADQIEALYNDLSKEYEKLNSSRESRDKALLLLKKASKDLTKTSLTENALALKKFKASLVPEEFSQVAAFEADRFSAINEFGNFQNILNSADFRQLAVARGVNAGLDTARAADAFRRALISGEVTQSLFSAVGKGDIKLRQTLEKFIQFNSEDERSTKIFDNLKEAYVSATDAIKDVIRGYSKMDEEFQKKNLEYTKQMIVELTEIPSRIADVLNPENQVNLVDIERKIKEIGRLENVKTLQGLDRGPERAQLFRGLLGRGFSRSELNQVNAGVRLEQLTAGLAEDFDKLGKTLPAVRDFFAVELGKTGAVNPNTFENTALSTTFNDLKSFLNTVLGPNTIFGKIEKLRKDGEFSISDSLKTAEILSKISTENKELSRQLEAFVSLFRDTIPGAKTDRESGKEISLLGGEGTPFGDFQEISEKKTDLSNSMKLVTEKFNEFSNAFSAISDVPNDFAAFKSGLKKSANGLDQLAQIFTKDNINFLKEMYGMFDQLNKNKNKTSDAISGNPQPSS